MGVRRVVNRGREADVCEAFSVNRLTGIIKAVIHRVSVISGAERWSSVKM